MSRVLVSGLINLETTVRVDGFPVPYFPVRYPFWGVRSTVSGVGYNVAKALRTLGDDVRMLSLIGRDGVGDLVHTALAACGLASADVLAILDQTAQSVILYDGEGRRQIHVDLKDIQEQTYPPERAGAALVGCDLAALCNINFSRPLLSQARAAGVSVATDVHALAQLDDAYNHEFMAAAEILFMSDEALPAAPEEWAAAVQARYGNAIIVIGLGAQGALLAVRDDGFTGRFPAVAPRPVVNTIGAGDALFASFLHFYGRRHDPYDALRRAIVFAGYKVGSAGAAEGFLDEAGVNLQTRASATATE
jgi:acarbose 7IV-phosphotransferase